MAATACVEPDEGPATGAPRSCRSRLSTTVLYAVCFLAPVALLCAVAAATGVYPFGDQAFLSSDLRDQYIDFLSWFRGVLTGEGSIFFSFAQGLGMNTWGLYSFYVASPFNLLVVFFDTAHLPSFLFIVSALRMGLASMAMAFYLRRRFCLPASGTFALSLSYGCSLWVFTNLRSIMWMDGLIVLPLACLAVRTLVRDGRIRGLAAAVAASVVLCWYTAYMMLVFLVFYLVYEWIALGEAGESRVAAPLRAFVRFAGASVLGVLLSAWTFVPTVFAQLQSSGATSVRMQERIDLVLGVASGFAGELGAPLVIALVLVLATALTGIVLAIVHGLRGPHRARCLRILGACGALCFLAACAFATFTGPGARLLALVARCDLPALIRSFFVGGWIEEKTPQLAVGFVPLALAVCFFASARIPRRERMWAFALLAVQVAMVYLLPLEMIWCGLRHPKGFFSRPAVYVVFFMLMLAARAWPIVAARVRSLMGGPRLVLRAAALAVPAVCAVELAAGGVLAWRQVYRGFSQSFFESYTDASNDQARQVRELDSGVYRFDRNYARSGAALNESMSLGMRSASTYCSANNEHVIALLASLGYGIGDMPERYTYPNLLSDALLGIEYASVTEGATGMEQVLPATSELVHPVYRNPLALPLGYAVDEHAAGADVFGRTPFETQERLAAALTGAPTACYQSVAAEELPSEDPTVRTWRVAVPEGCYGYAFVQAGDSTAPLGVSVDGGPAVTENTQFQLSVRPLSDTAGGVHEVTLSGIPAGVDAGCVFAAIDPEAVARMSSGLGSHPFVPRVFEDGHVEGTVDATAGQDLLMTFPNDGGWTVRVNGKAVETEPVAGGALTLIPVPEGRSDIEMTYISPGFGLGCAVSAVTVAGVVVSRCARVRHRRRADR